MKGNELNRFKKKCSRVSISLFFISTIYCFLLHSPATSSGNRKDLYGQKLAKEAKMRNSSWLRFSFAPGIESASVLGTLVIEYAGDSLFQSRLDWESLLSSSVTLGSLNLQLKQSEIKNDVQGKVHRNDCSKKVFSTLFPLLVIGVFISLCIHVSGCFESVWLLKHEIKSFEYLKAQNHYYQ